MYQALYRKYRPKNFDEVVGQDIIVKTLKNSILSQKINHAYIFTGTRGSGKTSIAKIFARTVNCENPIEGKNCQKCVCCTQTDEQNMDIIEIDAASNNGVDEIREINNKVSLVPSLGKYKIYIIDEVHMLTIGAFNALLKTLEEPPAHAIFILATTDPQKVPTTILSRCQRFDFKKISENKIVERLLQIVKKEKINIEDDCLYEIARLSDGSLRDALGILDQVLIYALDKINIEDVHDINGTVTQFELQSLIYNVVNNNITLVLNDINKYCENGKNIPKITEEILYLMRNIVLYKTSVNSVSHNDEQIKNILEVVTLEKLIQYISILNEALINMRKSINSRMILELAFIKIYSSENREERVSTGNNMKENNSENKEFSNESKSNQLGNQETINIKKNESKSSEKSKISQEIKTDIDNYKLELENFKNIRIGNVLARFSKIKTAELKKSMIKLNDYMLDEKNGNLVAMILDGELKAASENAMIFVFATKTLSETFNENITKLEKLINKILNNKYKIISTDINDWDKIKQQFNLKKVEYEYVEEKISIEEILKNKKNSKSDINNMFGELLEYK